MADYRFYVLPYTTDIVAPRILTIQAGELHKWLKELERARAIEVANIGLARALEKKIESGTFTFEDDA